MGEPVRLRREARHLQPDTAESVQGHGEVAALAPGSATAPFRKRGYGRRCHCSHRSRWVAEDQCIVPDCIQKRSATWRQM